MQNLVTVHADITISEPQHSLWPQPKKLNRRWTQINADEVKIKRRGRGGAEVRRERVSSFGFFLFHIFIFSAISPRLRGLCANPFCFSCLFVFFVAIFLRLRPTVALSLSAFLCGSLPSIRGSLKQGPSIVCCLLSCERLSQIYSSNFLPTSSIR